MTTTILQFGTSRFLQAHADLFLSEARAAGQPIGRICVVQSSGAAERAGRVAAFNDPAGFPIQIRGLADGTPVERTKRVTGVVRGLSAGTDWPEILRVAVAEAEILISNTADAGYAMAADARVDLDGDTTVAPTSFPEKLLALLAARHRAGRPGLTLFPCELIERNGDHLKALVTGLAARSGASADLLGWLEQDCLWANSLVDRIVSAPLKPLGAVAEPYALWAIENQPGLAPPCDHPAVQMVDDLEPVAALKLFLLNLAHTWLAERWDRAGRDPDALVRQAVGDPATRAALVHLYERELIPGFAPHGMEAAARAYVAVTLERFANPFLDHRLAEIVINHRQKVERRIVAFLAWSALAGLPQPDLRAIAARHGFAVAAPLQETSR